MKPTCLHKSYLVKHVTRYLSDIEKNKTPVFKSCKVNARDIATKIIRSKTMIYIKKNPGNTESRIVEVNLNHLVLAI